MSLKIPEEHDLESQIRKEREWRFLRNTRVRKQAQQLIQKGEWSEATALVWVRGGWWGCGGGRLGPPQIRGPSEPTTRGAAADRRPGTSVASAFSCFQRGWGRARWALGSMAGKPVPSPGQKTNARPCLCHLDPPAPNSHCHPTLNSVTFSPNLVQNLPTDAQSAHLACSPVQPIRGGAAVGVRGLGIRGCPPCPGRCS